MIFSILKKLKKVGLLRLISIYISLLLLARLSVIFNEGRSFYVILINILPFTLFGPFIIIPQIHKYPLGGPIFLIISALILWVEAWGYRKQISDGRSGTGMGLLIILSWTIIGLVGYFMVAFTHAVH